MVVSQKPIFELVALIDFIEKVREGIRPAERVLDAAGAAVCAVDPELDVCSNQPTGPDGLCGGTTPLNDEAAAKEGIALQFLFQHCI